jgi:hypothetical protein
MSRSMKFTRRIPTLATLLATLAACGGSGIPETSGSSAGAWAVDPIWPDGGCPRVGNVFCPNGDWDSQLCRCGIPDAACVDNIECILRAHWDPKQCKCVPSSIGCRTASDCGGPLPLSCHVCPGGATAVACVHWECVDAGCQTVTCE